MTEKKRRISVRIDMTPMVDIAFLLLIFYMATTQFKPPEAHAVELPLSHSMIELPAKDIINITVTRYNSIYVDYLEKRTINLDGKDVAMQVRVVKSCKLRELVYEINRARAKAAGKKIRPFIVIKADHRASYGMMDRIMTSMQQNELNRFLVITEKEVEEAMI